MKLLTFKPVDKPIPSGTIGHALYLMYREERTRQGIDEWKWESLSLAQCLVWERLAQRLLNGELK